MNAKYQLVLLGHPNPFKDRIVETFFTRIEDLGLSKDSIAILNESNFKQQNRNFNPTVVLYFGGTKRSYPHVDTLKVLIHEAATVLPIVSDLARFKRLVPTELHSINGFSLNTEQEIEALVSTILEGFSLLRVSRRLFISYKRSESSGVAIQLFEQFEKAGFDVFLDTYSLRPGDIFQDELWHRLADTDVVILLNTAGFCASKWTTMELAEASGMAISILQLVWPENLPLEASDLTTQLRLRRKDFENKVYERPDSSLSGKLIPDIVSKVESLRARSLGARQDNLITEFLRVTQRRHISASLQPQKYIIINQGGRKREKVIIPTVGVPQAFLYNKSDELVKRSSRERDMTCIYFMIRRISGNLG